MAASSCNRAEPAWEEHPAVTNPGPRRTTDGPATERELSSLTAAWTSTRSPSRAGDVHGARAYANRPLLPPSSVAASPRYALSPLHAQRYPLCSLKTPPAAPSLLRECLLSRYPGRLGVLYNKAPLKEFSPEPSRAWPPPLPRFSTFSRRACCSVRASREMKNRELGKRAFGDTHHRDD
jgi:hypothetical protein